MKQVLILDDDAQTATQLAAHLTSLGFQAATVQTPQRALEQIQGGEVAVLVAGQSAGGRPGVDMIKLMRQVSPDTRSLLVGFDATAREYKVALENGAVEVLTLPYTERDLVHAVRKALECEEGFHGSIHGLSLVDLLQMVHYARRSLVVRLGPETTIHMFEGEIIHAVCPPLFGMDALRKLLAARSGSLSTAPFDSCPRTIEGSFELLLLEVMQQIDEENHRPAPTTHCAQGPATFDSAVLPPAIAPVRRPRRGRLAMAIVAALLAGLAAGALLLFLLAPVARPAPAIALPPDPPRAAGPITVPLRDETSSLPTAQQPGQ